MTNRKPFKAGDRVRVFRGNRKPIDGVVIDVGENAVFVNEDGFYSAHDDGPFHPRQCVRLVPRKRRRVWINPHNVVLTVKPDESDDRVWGEGPWREFREVRKHGKGRG